MKYTLDQHLTSLKVTSDISGPLGSGEASQDYVGDGTDKLSLKQGVTLTILGENEQFFLARVGDDEPGLVAKHFVKRQDLIKEAQVDVSAHDWCGITFLVHSGRVTFIPSETGLGSQSAENSLLIFFSLSRSIFHLLAHCDLGQSAR